MTFIEKNPAAIYFYAKVIGGEVPGPAFSQKCGSYKLNGKQVGATVKEKTSMYKNQKITVLIEVIVRAVTVYVVPSVSQMIIRELNENRPARKKGGDKVLRHHNYPLSLDKLFAIVEETIESKKSRSLTKRGVLCEVLGSALSVGCTIEEKSPKEVTRALKESGESFAKLFGKSVNDVPAYVM
ncbi:RL12 [Hepatospora eriocheir]|uniref:RL12 n=1 Tax=Hepatospora eriocheir TaxID=1081669 RepID=A0A1X0QBY6_9MICR|nr:RL12 [Hepatospora eriocheir]